MKSPNSQILAITPAAQTFYWGVPQVSRPDRVSYLRPLLRGVRLYFKLTPMVESADRHLVCELHPYTSLLEEYVGLGCGLCLAIGLLGYPGQLTLVPDKCFHESALPTTVAAGPRNLTVLPVGLTSPALSGSTLNHLSSILHSSQVFQAVGTNCCHSTLAYGAWPTLKP